MGEKQSMKQADQGGSPVYRVLWWAVYLLAFLAAPLAIWINYRHNADASTLLKMALPLGIVCLFLIARLIFLHSTRNMSRMVRKEAGEGFMCILPWLVGFVSFTLGPMLFSIYIAMCDWDIINPPRFVGLANFQQALFHDFRFLQALKVTITYAMFALPLGLTGALMVALLLNQKVKGMSWFRTIFYIPAILPGIATAMLWRWIFNPENGILNLFLNGFMPPASRMTSSISIWPIALVVGLLAAVLIISKRDRSSRAGIVSLVLAFPLGGVIALAWNTGFRLLSLSFAQPAPLWLADPAWALPAFILMSLWGVGGGMIIYLAGLQSIPTQLYEAAEIDGANPVQKFWKITLPMVTPTIFFNLVMGVIGSFQVFTSSFVMTQGGPHYATLFYLLYLYQKAFQYFQMGYAAAMAWILFVVILICTLLVFKSSAGWVYYEAEVKGRR
ncbi:MAG TPA: sugar ABC transporter permease [Armatimonadota bacterium]|nr:sugar ABC transporter permease [Armatimonadota bacterium]